MSLFYLGYEEVYPEGLSLLQRNLSLSQMMYIMVFSIYGVFTYPHMNQCSSVRAAVLEIQNIDALFPGFHLGNLAFKACQTL